MDDRKKIYMIEKLLEIKNLVKNFPIYGGLLSKEIAKVQAVRDVSFDIAKGETVGLVGESGCGKSTLGRVILRLYPPDSGEIKYDGNEIFKYNPSQVKKIRKKMQMIFQDPYASLNPRVNVGNIVGEPLIIHKLAKGKKRQDKIVELLETVGLRADAANKYPHEFSGGQRQRIGIARALAVEPEFIICDEPVSALDVSIQSQIINLLSDLQTKFGLTYLFISHDLKVVSHISDRVVVMYLGKVMEILSSEEIYKKVKHPYSIALISAVPEVLPKKREKRILLKGDVPSPINPPKGCSFNTRCYMREDICFEKEPEIKQIEKGHLVACHLVSAK